MLGLGLQGPVDHRISHIADGALRVRWVSIRRRRLSPVESETVEGRFVLLQRERIRLVIVRPVPELGRSYSPGSGCSEVCEEGSVVAEPRDKKPVSTRSTFMS